MAFSPDGGSLATASYDGHIGLFDVASGNNRKMFPAHEGRVTSIAFNQQGNLLLSAGNDGRLRLWDMQDLNQSPQEIGQAQNMLMCAGFSSDDRQVAAVGRGAIVNIYDLSNPGTPRRLPGHEQTVFRAIYSPDGRHLATVSGDMTVRLWDMDSLRLPTELKGDDVPLWDFDFRCVAGECLIAVPLTVGLVALYSLPYEHPPASILPASAGDK